MLDRAIADYGSGISAGEVLALYDATRLGTGGDGALFAADRFLFQNNNLERGQTVRYSDLVGVRSHRRLLGGRYVEIEVNRGRATVQLRVDFSARADAAGYVARFLNEAMLHEPSDLPTDQETDWHAVEVALRELEQTGQLSSRDLERLLRAARRTG